MLVENALALEVGIAQQDCDEIVDANLPNWKDISTSVKEKAVKGFMPYLVNYSGSSVW